MFLSIQNYSFIAFCPYASTLFYPWSYVLNIQTTSHKNAIFPVASSTYLQFILKNMPSIWANFNQVFEVFQGLFFTFLLLQQNDVRRTRLEFRLTTLLCFKYFAYDCGFILALLVCNYNFLVIIKSLLSLDCCNIENEPIVTINNGFHFFSNCHKLALCLRCCRCPGYAPDCSLLSISLTSL